MCWRTVSFSLMNGGLCCTPSSKFTARLSSDFLRPRVSVRCHGLPGSPPRARSSKPQNVRKTFISLLVNRLPLARGYDARIHAVWVIIWRVEELDVWLGSRRRSGAFRRRLKRRTGGGSRWGTRGLVWKEDSSGWANSAGFVAWCFPCPTGDDFPVMSIYGQ